MIKIDDHTAVDLDALAENHYNNLISPLLVNGVDYHATSSLIGRIRVQREIDFAIPNQQRVDFWDYLLDNTFINLKRVITSRPDDLKTIITEIENICGVGFFSNDIDYDRSTLTDFGKVVKTIFNYKSYRDDPECESNCNQFNLAFCPYCNSIETQVITVTTGLTGIPEQQALLQLDHFYPQSRHPYFSLSFFNLIPGCSPCNAQLKREKRFDIDTHFNPFHKRLDEYFQFELKTLILNKDSDVEITYSNKQPYFPYQLVDFKVIERYNNANKRFVFKLFKTFKNHSPKISKSIGQQIKGLFTINESKTKGLLDNYDIPLNRNEINEVRLGKLKRDIAIQLGILINP